MTEEVVVAMSLCAVIVVVAAWHRRSSLDRRNDVFPCGIRPAGPRDGVRLRSWRRVKAHWVGDVLVVKAGILRRSRWVFHVRCAHHILDLRVRASARSTASIHLELDTGCSIEVTTTRDHLDALAGPFLTAHPALAQHRIDRRR
jgi:hypothetical protein